MAASADPTGVYGARPAVDGPIRGDKSRHGVDAPSDRLGHDERQRGRLCGHVAVAAGVVTAASAASLSVYYVLDGPFGTINDYGNGLAGALSALLAWTLRPRAATATGAAILGAALTITGSALVISEATGYFLAGLVSSVGFALIGLWLIALNRALRSDARVPRRLTTLGLVAGAVMTLGLASAPGIALTLDDIDTAPAWIWIGSLNWLGTYALFPIWSIRLGRAQTRDGPARRCQAARGARNLSPIAQAPVRARPAWRARTPTPRSPRCAPPCNADPGPTMRQPPLKQGGPPAWPRSHRTRPPLGRSRHLGPTRSDCLGRAGARRPTRTGR